MISRYVGWQVFIKQRRQPTDILYVQTIDSELKSMGKISIGYGYFISYYQNSAIFFTTGYIWINVDIISQCVMARIDYLKFTLRNQNYYNFS